MDDLDLGATIKGFIPGQKVFGRYTLTKILGRGGMGVVWLARDEKLERDIALKFLPEVVAADPRAVDELKRETRRSLELTHPHIVRIYDFVEDARTAAIAMEYIPGATLAKLALEQPQRAFDPEALTAWVKQLCEALDYAHRKAKVVHRDLKPANLMVDAAGELKIADFGIAASVSDSVSRVSMQVGTSGTPVYMSPQQMMGEKPAVTDDIYALGATLYDLLTGKPPFHTGNVILQVQSKVPPSIAERRAELEVRHTNIPPEWEATLAACLAKEAEARPQSAGEVLARLSGVAVPPRTSNNQHPTSNNQGSIREADKGSSGPSKIRNPKSKIPAMASAAAAIAVIAAAGWWFGIHTPEQRRIESERLQVEQARMESERQQAETIRIAAEREAEARRIEAARVAAEHEAERQRIAAARGGIIVRTTPAGAEVRVGAVAMDKSPLTLKDQRLGKYPVRVRLAGYEDWDGEVEVRENEFAKLNVPLVRSTGAVTLTSDPAGLDYTIKGEVTRTGRTPAELTLPTGRYDITFSRPGWPEQVRTVEVKRTEQVQASGDFVGGAIELTSTPSGAEVWSDGRQVGTTPYSVAEALPGRYDYELRLARYRAATAALTVETRKTARENVLLTVNPVLAATKEEPYENSLGMKFVPVPGTNVLFSIWETRVQDFEAFVKETGHDATQGLYSLRPIRGFREYGDTWKSPGFAQGLTHPVVGVNQSDARAFCRWLTGRERRAGRLAPDQEYRLPTDAEWDAAVGKDEFPWGSQWPPPSGAGNYPGTEAREGNWPSGWATTDGYSDGFANTAPVGSFTANTHGIYDLGGNAWEYVGDRPHGLRGASFLTSLRGYLTSSYRNTYDARRRVDMGFRTILAVGSDGPQSHLGAGGLEMQTLPSNLNSDAVNQASLQTEGQELLPGILVATLDESLRRQHGLPPNENTGLVIVSAAGRYAQLLPVGSLLKEVNRVPVVDANGAKQNLRPGRNLALLWAKGSIRYVMLEVDAASLQ
jgi:serine/threonine protein kinase